MSILITDMEMPTGGSIIVAIRPDGMVEDVMGCFVGKATPVPPHGRLVDADKMIWKFTPDERFYPTKGDRLAYDSGKLMIRDIRGFIRDQPTIIQAEETAKKDGGTDNE